MPSERIVIIGAGQAGGRAAEALRREDYKGEVVLLGDERHEPYERPALSKSVLTNTEPASATRIHPRDWYASNGIDLRTGRRVEAIAPLSRTVIMSDGEGITYSKLLICTGSRVRPLTVAQDGMRGVHYLRTIEDCERLRTEFTGRRRVVVIGGGFVGLEVASSAAKLGMFVTVVERQPSLLDRALPAAIASYLERAYRAQGVALELGARVVQIRGGGTVESVEFEDGRSVKADLVVIGVGVIPNTELAEAAGAESSDGVVVDEFCRTSLEGIYAAGDVTSHYNPILERRIRLESWQNAQNQAIAAAGNMIGANKPYAEVPWFWSDQLNVHIQLVGVVEPGLEIVWRGDPGSAKCMAFGLLDGRVRLAAAFNSGNEIRFARRLIELRAEVTPRQLADQGVKLKDFFSDRNARTLAA